MKNKSNFGEYLYNKLPEFYIVEDKEGQLERFLKIFGVPTDKLYEKIYDYQYMFDPNKSQDIFVPELLQMLGFRYYKDVPLDIQRKFLKALPHLNAIKGTSASFEYLVRELSGYSVISYSDPEDKNTFHVRIIVPEDKSIEFTTNESAIKRYMEYIRPVNTKIILYILFRGRNSIKVAHKVTFKVSLTFITNPWIASADVIDYMFDGTLNFDGNALFNGSSGEWRGMRHNVYFSEEV